MATDKNYICYVLDTLSKVGGVTARPMMGEYIIYYKGKVIGGVYDNRFLVKNVAKARALMPDCTEELPYDGAKPMLSVENIEDTVFIKKLFDAIFEELPSKK